VPNRISLAGHTDTTPYVARNGYTNWDLSADRANAARRALEAGGLHTDKMARVVGLSSVVLFDKENPRNPINRRISIIVMTKQAEEAALNTDARDAGRSVESGTATDGAAGSAAAATSASPASPALPVAPAAPGPATAPAAAGTAAPPAPVSKP
jgi:chemotaxis protein MotB